ASARIGAPVASRVHSAAAKRAAPAAPPPPNALARSPAVSGRKLTAKAPLLRMVSSAEVLRSTETSIMGGSALTWLAERASRPLGPFASLAVTTVIPIARWPKVLQKVRASTWPPSGASVISGLPGPAGAGRLYRLDKNISRRYV